MRQTSSTLRRLSISALLLAAGCSFRTEVPAGHTIACSGEPGAPACPEGYACKPALGRCVPVADLSREPAGVGDAQVAPAAGNAATTFTATFSVTGPLARPPVVYATGLRLGGAGAQVETYPFACGACAPGAPCACTYTPDPARLPPEGPLAVRVEIVDAVGNAPPPTAAGTVLFDLTAPSLEGTPSLEFGAGPGVDVPVSALGPGGSLGLCFGVSEPLAAPPVVWAAAAVEDAPGAGAIPFALEPGYPLGLRYCVRASPGDAGLDDGPRHLLAALTDLAGNRAVREVADPGDGGPALWVDATPPPPPGLDEPDGLRYLRAPAGDGDRAAPYFRLGSPGPALAEAGFLRVFEDAAGERELAHAPVEAGRLDPPLELPGPDRAEVWVQLYDRAGNPSPGGPRKVRSVDFVAALGGKVAGDTVANPHACYARAVHGPGLVQGDDALTEQGAAQGPDPEAADLARVAGRPTWRQRHPGVPDSLSSADLAYDSARGRAVGFLYQLEVATWLFDGRDFDRVDGLQLQPSQRTRPGMAYDAARDRVVLFGGAGFGASFFCDTWEWDGRLWRPVTDCHAADGGTVGPGPRSAPGLAYDAERGRVVLVGGEAADEASLSDSWEWDGQAWRRLPDGPAAPPPKMGGSLVWARRPDGTSALLYGGGDQVPDGGEFFESTQSPDVWLGAFSPDAGGYAWQRVSGQVCPDADPYCGSVRLAADPGGAGFWQVHQALVGNDLVTGLLRWDGLAAGGWQSLGQSLEVGALTAFVGMPAHGDALLYAGNQAHAGGTDPSVLLVYADGGFLPVHDPETAATPRWGAGLAIDGQGRGLLVGGVEDDPFGGGSGEAAGADFAWSGDDWVALLSTQHSGRLYPAVAYWPGESSAWLFGGRTYPGSVHLGDLWRYGTDWAAVAAPAGLGTPEGPRLAWVPDAGPERGQALLLASEDGPTWLLSRDGGIVATPVADAGPRGGLAYDPRRGTAVIAAINGGIYELAPGAASWAQVTASGPHFGSAVYDPQLGEVVLLGESPGGALPGDAWSWDGARLAHLDLADPEGDGQPPVRADPAVAYDPARERVLLYGGASTSLEIQGDTWELQRAEHRPAEVCQLRFAAARAAPGAVLTGLAVRAVAEAEGPAGAAPAALELYLDGAWREVARCSPPACAPGAPGPLAYQARPAELGGLLTQRQTLGVAVTPAARNGGGAARVGVRGLQAVFSYRLP